MSAVMAIAHVQSGLSSSIDRVFGTGETRIPSMVCVVAGIAIAGIAVVYSLSFHWNVASVEVICLGLLLPQVEKNEAEGYPCCGTGIVQVVVVPFFLIAALPALLFYGCPPTLDAEDFLILGGYVLYVSVPSVIFALTLPVVVRACSRRI